MALFKDFTFDGENSKDYGVYISGDAVYDAPERAMDMVQIPGRNGALALDNGYYNNIPVTYPAGCFADDQADFAAKLSRIRNMLASRHRYCRLEDAYHPDHFRMALYKSGLDVAPVARNKAGRFNIIFDAKPQRFLKSGEVVQEFDADAPPTTSYGPADIVTFEGEPGDAIVHAQLSLEPIQDLHGYGNPWPAGGGKNKFPDSSEWEAGTIGTNGQNTTGNYFRTKDFYPIKGGQAYIFSGATSGELRFFFYDSSKTFLDYKTVNSFTTPNTAAYLRARWRNSLTLTNVQLEEGSTPTAYAPYSNICPISGHTEVSVVRTGKNLLDASSLTWTSGIRNDDGSAGSSTSSHYTNAIQVKPSTDYTLSGTLTSGSSGFRIYYLDANQGWISRTAQSAGSSYHFVTPSNCGFIQIQVVNPVNLTAAQLELGSTPTTYEPFNGTTYLTDWGINQFDKSTIIPGYYINDANGVATSAGGSSCTDYIPVIPNASYYIKSEQTQGAWGAWYDANKNYISGITGYRASDTETSKTKTAPSNAAYMRLTVRYSSSGNVDTFAVNYPSTFTDYHPYADPHVGIVYGGTLNVKTGVLTITHRGFDGGDLSWTKVTGNNYRNFYHPNTPTALYGANLKTVISSQYKSESNNTATSSADNYVWIRGSETSNEIAVKDTSKANMTGAEFQTAMTGVTFVYELKTPTTVQLTPTEVATLLGVNNIFSDTGTTTITVQSPYKQENPTLYPSRPLIRVYGSGTIQVNNITITVAEHSGYIDIDCDMMDCHRGADNMNQYVSFSGNDFPELQPGINRILLNGPDKVEITPRWWEL